MKTLWIVLFTLCLTLEGAFSQDPVPFHRIRTATSDELITLFQRDGQTMPLVSAHRGGAATGYPENCIATFEHTLRGTFSILEIDLQSTKDRQIVLHHDATLQRTTTGTGPVENWTLQELKALQLKDTHGQITQYHMPTLDEALEWARGKTIVILDHKNVSIATCVAKIEEHRAEAYAMVMTYSLRDVQACYNLNQNILMEVMIGDRNRFREFEATGIPWNRIVAFVGHTPPPDRQLLEMIHAKGVCCMAGTSRNLDPQLLVARDTDLVTLTNEYRARIEIGVDLIETDLPIQVAELLFDEPVIPKSKAPFFCLPSDSK